MFYLSLQWRILTLYNINPTKVCFVPSFLGKFHFINISSYWISFKFAKQALYKPAFGLFRIKRTVLFSQYQTDDIPDRDAKQ